ncbi:MAG: hypothetical protein L0287_17390 [Anaerolineae bacterium]|nr:hypothetical protein [Anaerolineae bacterium]
MKTKYPKDLHLLAVIAVLSCMVVCCKSASAGNVVEVTYVEQSGNSQSNVPITFGQVFREGDVLFGQSLTASLADGTGLPLQVDAKAYHRDGSLKHAVLTVLLGTLNANSADRVNLSATASGGGNPEAVSPQALLNTDYDVNLVIDIGGTIYSASARQALHSALAEGNLRSWLNGPLVSEWILDSPIKDASGVSHPHLCVRFNVRAYSGLQRVRTEAIVENDWAYEPSPMGFTYDVTISLGNTIVYSKSNLMHTHHARWRKIVWTGTEPDVAIMHDSEYLMATGVVPNYDKRVQVSQSATSDMTTNFEPMSNIDISQHMPDTGAQDGIGPLPRWSAIYLLTMDPRARANTLANGDAGGSYQIHYRDKDTDLPVTLDDYPYMSLLGTYSDTYNPNTGQYEAFPDVSNGLERYTPDDAHQPSIAYLPYIITGDYYYLEELHFWANYNLIMPNPNSREFEKGLLNSGQVRAQAWSLRTLGHAASITPDDHPLKNYFVDRVRYNLEWYVTEYVNNTGRNGLGWIENGYALSYGAYGIAPWQDDFFTWSIGQLVKLGFPEAQPLLEWKAKFVIGRMTGQGYCWLQATAYSLQVGTMGGVYYSTFAEIYTANFGHPACSGFEMDGYPESSTGYGANMQPALAAAVEAAVANSAEAWAIYETRSPRQDYSSAPQFAITPSSGDDGSVSVRDSGMPGKIPDTPVVLDQNYPNPFNPETTIEYFIPHPSYVTLKIFNVHGEDVATLVSEFRPAGRHAIKWDATGLASGSYFCRLSLYSTDRRAQPYSIAERKLLLLR